MAKPSTYVDRLADINRDLLELWTNSAIDSLKTWTELAHTAQSTLLKTYQTSAKLFETAPTPTE